MMDFRNDPFLRRCKVNSLPLFRPGQSSFFFDMAFLPNLEIALDSSPNQSHEVWCYLIGTALNNAKLWPGTNAQSRLSVANALDVPELEVLVSEFLGDETRVNEGLQLFKEVVKTAICYYDEVRFQVRQARLSS